MAIKWRAIGSFDIRVTDTNVEIAQAIEVYDDADPATALATETITAGRNFDRVTAGGVPELRSLADEIWLPKATAACERAKRNQQADGYEAQGASYIATLQAAQAGV